MRLRLPNRDILFPRRPLLMGIVNVNDDSFSHDGSLIPDEALATARDHIRAGADVVDFGAESARTNRAAIPVDEEIRRVAGVIGRWNEVIEGTEPRDEIQIWPPVLSVNTWRPEVIAAVLRMSGVELINDMSALPDATHARLCAEAGAALLIMHSVGEPKVPHVHQKWRDVIGDMERFFIEKIHLATSAGLSEEAVIFDPGIDFAKQQADNLSVYRSLDRFARMGRPLLVPVSRKTVIGEVLDLPDPRDRDAGSMACIAASMARGGHVFRVHNVEAAWQTVKTLNAVL